MAVLSLNTNLASLQTQRRLSQSTAVLSKSYERLGSGLRVSRGSDDAAGLAIASGLSADTRIFSQAVRNLSDGVSVTSIAEGALNELTNIVTRLEELAEQSSNGTLGMKQRAALDAEAQALSKEYARIARTTSFNGQKLFNGNVQGLLLQAGAGANSVLRSSLGGALGDGTFGASRDYLTPASPSLREMAVGDLNGDGILDMVTEHSGATSILIGNGDGSFRAYATVLAPSGSYSVALGDLNNDGYLDIASVGATAEKVFTLLGNGDGTFRRALSFSTNGTYLASNPYELALGDLNGDGRLDIVTANEGGRCGASVLLGAGDGTFGIADRIGSFDQYTSVALADINGDQIIDIVGGLLDSALYSMLGNGDGTFKSENIYTTPGMGPDLVSVADLNGDGRLDAAIGNPAETSLTILLGNGDGSFNLKSHIDLDPDQVASVAIGDLNGDGVLDLAVSGYTIGGEAVRVFIGNGDATFAAPVSYGSGTAGTRAITLADLNRDGVLDIAAADYASNKVAVLVGNTRDGVAPLLEFSLKTKSDAKWALELMKQKLTQLSQQRGIIGANQSRLSTALATLQVEGENYSAASSQIMDVDVAQESSHLLRSQILQQAASAVLAQANQLPALALSLLNG